MGNKQWSNSAGCEDVIMIWVLTWYLISAANLGYYNYTTQLWSTINSLTITTTVYWCNKKVLTQAQLYSFCLQLFVTVVTDPSQLSELLLMSGLLVKIIRPLSTKLFPDSRLNFQANYLYLPLQFGELRTQAACFPRLPTREPTQLGCLWHGGRWSRERRRRMHIGSVRWALEATPQLSHLLSTGAKNLQSTQGKSSGLSTSLFENVFLLPTLLLY